MFRIFLAQQRAAADAMVVAALLRAWLREPPPGEALREPAGLALERLVAATQVRFPVVADLARGVVFAWFGQPLLRRNRARVYADVRKHLRYLDAQPGRARPRRAHRRDGRAAPSRWCGCSASGSSATHLDNAVMLEVLTRRYYGNKGLAERPHQRGRRAADSWSPSGAGSRVVSAAVSFDALGDALRGLAELAGGGDAVDADIYLAWEKQPEDSDAMAAALHEVRQRPARCRARSAGSRSRSRAAAAR